MPVLFVDGVMAPADEAPMLTDDRRPRLRRNHQRCSLTRGISVSLLAPTSNGTTRRYSSESNEWTEQWRDHQKARPESVSKRLGIETRFPPFLFGKSERTTKRGVNRNQQISRTERPMKEATYETNMYCTPNRWTAVPSLGDSRGNSMSISWGLSAPGQGCSTSQTPRDGRSCISSARSHGPGFN